MTIDGGVGWDRYTGYGMVNANAALNTIVSGMPTCQITSPADGASFALNSIITINVNATDSNGSIASVKTYINNILYNTDYSDPYSYNWNTTGLTAGSYTIKAVAKDNSNNETISEISISLIQPVSEAIIGTGTSVTGNSAPSPINVWYNCLHTVQSVYKSRIKRCKYLWPIILLRLGFIIVGMQRLRCLTLL